MPPVTARLVHVLSVLARRLPLRVAYLFAALAGTAVWLLWREKRENAIHNMRFVFDDRAAATRAARRSFINYARYIVDFFRTPALNAEQILARLSFDRWEEIDAAFAEGKGVIFISCHFGNWDMGGAVLAARGYPINVLADAVVNNQTNDVVMQARRTQGMKIIRADRRAPASIMRALRRNEGLALLIDQPTPEGGVAVTFFGATIAVPEGTARLALRTGARIVSVALARPAAGSDRWVALADLDIRPERTGDLERDVQALTQRIFSGYERFIRAYPDQWYIFRPLWPRRPLARVRR